MCVFKSESLELRLGPSLEEPCCEKTTEPEKEQQGPMSEEDQHPRVKRGKQSRKKLLRVRQVMNEKRNTSSALAIKSYLNKNNIDSTEEVFEVVTRDKQ